MPSKDELSRAYQAGYECIVFGPNTKNCHYTHFASPELTKTWGQGSQDAAVKCASGYDLEIVKPE